MVTALRQKYWQHESPLRCPSKLILTHDKGTLGTRADYLIDDRPHKANCDKFAGTLLHFKDGNGWPEILAYFRRPTASAPDSGEPKV